MSDPKHTTQIVAAILAGHAASKADKTQATSYVEKYIAVLQELNGRKDEIEAALKGPKSGGVMDVL